MQRKMFDYDTPESLDAEIRKVISKAIGISAENRASICKRMSELCGYEVSVHMLNCYTSSAKKPARFPALLVRTFCEVVGDDGLQRIVLSPRLRRLLELGELSLDVARNEKRIEAIRTQLLSYESPKSEKQQSSAIRAQRDTSAVTSHKKGERQ